MQCSRKKGNFMSYSCSDGKEIYKKAWCTCREFLSPLLDLLLFWRCLCRRRRRRRCRIKSFSSIFPCSFGRWFQMNMESTLSVATMATQMFSLRESMFITTRPRVRYIKNNQFSFNLFENFGGDRRRVMKCFSICRKKVCAPRPQEKKWNSNVENHWNIASLIFHVWDINGKHRRYQCYSNLGKSKQSFIKPI